MVLYCTLRRLNWRQLLEILRIAEWRRNHRTLSVQDIFKHRALGQAGTFLTLRYGFARQGQVFVPNTNSTIPNIKCTEEFSPPARTEALLLDEALACVALLNEVSQSGHILMDLGIPICEVSSEPKYKFERMIVADLGILCWPALCAPGLPK